MIGVLAFAFFIICGWCTHGTVALLESCSCCCEPKRIRPDSKLLSPAVLFISLIMFFEKELEDLKIQNV